MLCQVLFHKLCSALSYCTICCAICYVRVVPEIVNLWHVTHVLCYMLSHTLWHTLFRVLCHICTMPHMYYARCCATNYWTCFSWRYAPAFVPNVTPRNNVPHSVLRVVPGEHLAVEESVVRLCSFLLVGSADLKPVSHCESDLSKTSKDQWYIHID